MTTTRSNQAGGISFDVALTNYVGEFGRSQITILMLASLFWIGNGGFIGLTTSGRRRNLHLKLAGSGLRDIVNASASKGQITRVLGTSHEAELSSSMHMHTFEHRGALQGSAEAHLSVLKHFPPGLLILVMVFQSQPSPIKEHDWRCVSPEDAACAEVFAQEDPTRDFCSLPDHSWAWTKPSLSIVSRFDLVCGSAWKTQLANAGFFLGYLIGAGVFGSVSDSRGRKPVLFGCTALGAAATAIVGASPAYYFYLAFRLVTGIGAAGQALTCYILATESIGPKWRGFAGVATQLFFVVGELVLVPMALLLRPWRYLAFGTAVVNAALLVLWPFIPESPRWLFVVGRSEAAIAIISKIAAGNRRAMPDQPILCAEPKPPPQQPEEALQEGGTAALAPSVSAVCDAPARPGFARAISSASASRVRAPSPPTPGKVTLTWLLRNDPHSLRRFLTLAFVWLVVCMVYYGISLGLGGLPGSLYVTFVITSLAEIPANMLAAWLIERTGRHNTMAGGMILAGLACLGCALVPSGSAMAVAGLAAVGKFGVAGAFTIASIWTSEMFPTMVRSAVLGAENEAARLGGIAAPFIVLAANSSGSPALPYIVFGVAALVAGLAIFTLPETLGTAMPDNLADMGGIQSVFTTQPWRTGGWRQTVRELFRARGGPMVRRQSPAVVSAAVASNGVPVVDTPTKSAHGYVSLHVDTRSSTGSADINLLDEHPHQGVSNGAQMAQRELSGAPRTASYDEHHSLLAGGFRRHHDASPEGHGLGHVRDMPPGHGGADTVRGATGVAGSRGGRQHATQR